MFRFQISLCFCSKHSIILTFRPNKGPTILLYCIEHCRIKRHCETQYNNKEVTKAKP